MFAAPEAFENEVFPDKGDTSLNTPISPPLIHPNVYTSEGDQRFINNVPIEKAEDFVKIISNANNSLILTHKNPDLDALTIASTTAFIARFNQVNNILTGNLGIKLDGILALVTSPKYHSWCNENNQPPIEIYYTGKISEIYIPILEKIGITPIPLDQLGIEIQEQLLERPLILVDVPIPSIEVRKREILKEKLNIIELGGINETVAEINARNQIELKYNHATGGLILPTPYAIIDHHDGSSEGVENSLIVIDAGSSTAIGLAIFERFCENNGLNGSVYYEKCIDIILGALATDNDFPLSEFEEGGVLTAQDLICLKRLKELYTHPALSFDKEWLIAISEYQSYLSKIYPNLDQQYANVSDSKDIAMQGGYAELATNLILNLIDIYGLEKDKKENLLSISVTQHPYYNLISDNVEKSRRKFNLDTIGNHPVELYIIHAGRLDFPSSTKISNEHIPGAICQIQFHRDISVCAHPELKDKQYLGYNEISFIPKEIEVSKNETNRVVLVLAEETHPDGSNLVRFSIRSSPSLVGKVVFSKALISAIMESQKKASWGGSDTRAAGWVSGTSFVEMTQKNLINFADKSDTLPLIFLEIFENLNQFAKERIN